MLRLHPVLSEVAPNVCEYSRIQAGVGGCLRSSLVAWFGIIKPKGVAGSGTGSAR